MRVLTIGTFDLFHHGHLRLFRRAAEFGTLTVGVNSDRFVAEYKHRATVEDETLRMRRVAACRHYVSNVVLNDGPGIELVEQHRPDLVVVGSDWLPRDYPKQIGAAFEQLDDLGVGLVFLPRTPGVSTTELRAA